MRNQLKIYAILFCVCLFGASVLFALQETKNRTEPITKILPLDVDDVQAFEIHHFASAFRFEKIKDRWHGKKIYSKLADKIKNEKGTDIGIADQNFKKVNDVEITKAITYLLEQTTKNKIATQKSKPDTYEINPFSLQVMLYAKNNKKIGHIFIGKDGPDPMTSFIKLKNKNDVYLANQNFRLLFFRSIEEWRSPLKMPQVIQDQLTQNKK